MFKLVLLAFALSAPMVADARPARHQVAAKAALQLDAMVREEVKRTLPQGLSITALSLPRSLQRHASKSDIVSLAWRSPPEAGRAVVQVLLHKKGNRVKRGWARIELARIESVLVAAVDLGAGAILRASDLRLEQRPRSANDLVFKPTYLVGSRIVTSVKAGEAIQKDQVTMPTPVPRGTSVEVVVRRGRVSVGTSGILEAKTMVGANARVRVAGKILRGRLVRSDLVELGGVLR